MEFLPARGYEVTYLYTLDGYHTFHVDSGDDKDILLTRPQLRDFLLSSGCTHILGQEAVFSATFIKMIKELNLSDIKLVNQYHNTLLYFEKKLNWHFLKLTWLTEKSFKTRLGVAVRAFTYPLWRLKVMHAQQSIYRYNYSRSDMSVFLSEHELPIMGKIVGESPLKKGCAIPNPLSWAEIAAPEILQKKQREVLIVSRIYNFEKRIDLALKVWKRLQPYVLSNGWTLRIVGDGIHKEYLEAMAIRMGLKNIVWEGRRDPRPYYERSSVFMMTSCVEGWGLTLTESLQSGVVPVAFDSYSAVRSIISNGENGYLTRPMKVKEMADRIFDLMIDSEKREKMALKGIESAYRFSIDKIMDQWAEMLDKL